MEELKNLYNYKKDIDKLLNKLKSIFFHQLFTDIGDDPQNEQMTEQGIINLANNTFNILIKLNHYLQILIILIFHFYLH